MGNYGMKSLFYSKPLQVAALVVAGPLGCAVIYYAYFILRHIDETKYPSLASYYHGTGTALEIAAMAPAVALSIIYTTRMNIEPFKKANRSLPLAVLIALTAITAGLMALTVYRVFGTLDINTFTENYARYYALSRSGGAWMIFIGYGIMLIMLADMFYGGVNLKNSTFLLVCIFLNYITGGRTFPLLIMLAFMFLIYFQRPRIITLLVAISLCSLIGASSFLSASFLRYVPSAEIKSPPPAASLPMLRPEPKATQAPPLQPPTNDWSALNYNAAFILDDTIKKLSAGDIRPEAHAVNNFALFVPRFINPNKPRSDSETRLVYPDVAKRGTGTTITFPLKANLMLHFGTSAFYLNWVIVLIFQVGLVWAISRRQTSPSAPAFVMFLFGCLYFLVERAGFLNSRLLIYVMMAVAACACYRLATAPRFLDILENFRLWEPSSHERSAL